MYTFVLVVHVLACILLLIVILMQSGRGGGLTQAFAAAETVFGPKTNSILVRATTVVGLIFLTTSLSLAYLSAQKDKSLLMNESVKEQTLDPNKLFDEASKNVQTIEINAMEPVNAVETVNVVEPLKAVESVNASEQNVNVQ